MFWILIALLNPILHGWANIFDNYFSDKLFTKITALAFFGALTNVLFLPFVLLFVRPEFPPIHLLPAILTIAAIEVAYLYPYFKALQHGDTSVVASLFSIGKIFVPVFAYLIVREQLAPLQYVGFFLIIASSALLSIDRSNKFKFNRSFYYMLVCSIMLSIESVLYKFVFNDVGWATGFVWPTLFSFFLVLLLLFIPFFRRDVISHISVFRKYFHWFALEECLTFGGTAASTYATSLVPVTFERSIESFQPVFVLVYALLFKKYFPNLFHEKIDRRALLVKGFLFLLMMIGVILVV